MKPAADQRARDLAKIHVAKKQLGLSDEDYRAMLWANGRVHSAKDLDHAGRAAVLAHLERCGFKPVGGKKAGFTQAEMVQWLWRKLESKGALNNASEEALLAFCSKVCGEQVTSLRWLGPQQLGPVIEGLKSWLKRVDRKANLTGGKA